MFCTSFVLLYTAVFSQMQNHVSSAKGPLFPWDVKEDQRFKHRNTSSFSLWNTFLFFAVALNQDFHLSSLCNVQVTLSSRVCDVVISTEECRDESLTRRLWPSHQAAQAGLPHSTSPHLTGFTVEGSLPFQQKIRHFLNTYVTTVTFKTLHPYSLL